MQYAVFKVKIVASFRQQSGTQFAAYKTKETADRNLIMASILEKIFKKKNELQYVYAEYQPMDFRVNAQIEKHVETRIKLKKEDDMHIDKIYQSS